MLKMSRLWLVRATAVWPLCDFDTSLSFLEYFLPFWHNKMFQVPRVLSCPIPRMNYFFKEPKFLLVDNGTERPRSGYTVYF